MIELCGVYRLCPRFDVLFVVELESTFSTTRKKKQTNWYFTEKYNAAYVHLMTLRGHAAYPLLQLSMMRPDVYCA